MKKVVLVLLMLTMAGSAYAKDNYWDNKLLDKLKRGGINLVTAPGEIPKNVIEGWKKSDSNIVWKSILSVGSLGKGVVFTVGRFGSGLWDIFTFNLDVPAGYEPLMQPHYVYGND